MRVLLWWWLAAASICSCVLGAVNDTSDQCGLWGTLLEDWAVGEQEPALARQGRVMALPPTKGYYVSERIDGSLVPPPPHRPFAGSYGPQPGPHGPQAVPHGNPVGSYGPQPSPHGPHTSQPRPHAHQPAPHAPQPRPEPNNPNAGYSQYDEWQATPPPPPSAGKIVNRPPNPYKDKFKPSYNPAIPVSADRVDLAPPQKQVSETDLYLLTAIEKLVYRVDLMEKRLRKMEESVHYLIAGKDTKPDPCASGWRRVGRACYLWGGEAAPADWKAASLRCRKLRAHLLELDTAAKRNQIYSALLSDANLRGKDFWTSGLNPGLLWIWSHSARPLADNSTVATDTSSLVTGEGRCLALVHDPARATYVYRGLDCGLKHRYICEMDEDKEKLSNEIERVARDLKTVASSARKAKILWTDRR